MLEAPVYIRLQPLGLHFLHLNTRVRAVYDGQCFCLAGLWMSIIGPRG